LDKGKVIEVLRVFSPPLSSNQLDAIAEEISKISTDEILEIQKVSKPKRKSQSQV